MEYVANFIYLGGRKKFEGRASHEKKGILVDENGKFIKERDRAAKKEVNILLSELYYFEEDELDSKFGLAML